MASSNVARFNVGGEIFEIPLAKLRIMDNNKFLSLLCDRNVPFNKPDAGIYFIDRDPEMLMLLLEIFDGTTRIENLPKITRQILRHDCLYYGFSSLANTIPIEEIPQYMGTKKKNENKIEEEVKTFPNQIEEIKNLIKTKGCIWVSSSQNTSSDTSLHI